MGRVGWGGGGEGEGRGGRYISFTLGGKYSTLPASRHTD